MKTPVWKLRWSLMAVTPGLLLMLTAVGALGAIPSPSDYRNATQPMITGTAALVNEHQLLVSTEQGEDVLLSLDSRTMVPADLSAGMMMRVEFNYLEDGSRYAKRIIPIRSGHRTDRELAYSREVHDDAADVQFASTGHDQVIATRSSGAATVTNRPEGAPLEAVPATDAYIVATQPMIAGRVARVNDHMIAIDTDQGHRVALEMDSRTLVPTDLQSGMGVRVEYRTMENGTRLANRIVPIWDYEMNERELANVEMEYTEDAVVAQNEPSASSTTPATSEETAEQGAPVSSDRDEDRRLPHTASQLPLVALLGLLALGAAGALMMNRRLRVG